MTVRTLFPGDTFFLRTWPGGIFFSYVQGSDDHSSVVTLGEADMVVDPEKEWSGRRSFLLGIQGPQWCTDRTAPSRFSRRR